MSVRSPFPGEKLTNFDIRFIDQASRRYYIADLSNKSVDILDVKTDKFVGRVGGFVGVTMKDGKPNNDTSGPDGVLLADKGGDGTIASLRRRNSSRGPSNE